MYPRQEVRNNTLDSVHKSMKDWDLPARSNSPQDLS
jgi:hypothetical protein